MQKLKLFVLTSALVLIALLGASAQEKTNSSKTLLVQCSILDELDEHVQKRFLRADKTFGYARMTPRTHINQFYPIDMEERHTVNDLEKAGWQVGFYLAGRSVLGEKPSAEAWQVSNISLPLPPIKGVLPITKNVRTELLPEAQSLWHEAKNALAKLAKENHHEFSQGGWTFSARPIRARAECLQCHLDDKNIRALPSRMEVDANGKPLSLPASTLKVGDVLGIAIYAYRLEK